MYSGIKECCYKFRLKVKSTCISQGHFNLMIEFIIKNKKITNKQRKLLKIFLGTEIGSFGLTCSLTFF